MYIYLKHRKLGAIYAEFSKELGMVPLFMLEHCKRETIIHLFYTDIILTPPAALHDERKSKKHEYTNDQAADYPEGVPEN